MTRGKLGPNLDEKNLEALVGALANRDDDGTPRCLDYDSECVDVPGVTPDGETRSHLSCWLADTGRGYCPFLRKP